MEEEKPTSRIGGGMWILLIGSAIAVDATQIIVGLYLPVIGWIVNMVINVFYGILVALFFKLKGISMMKGGKALSLLISFAVDELTAGFAPAWTINMILTYRKVKSEERPDKISSKVFKVVEGVINNINGAQSQRPLNENGTRLPTRRSGTPVNANEVRLPRKTT